jgi:uncharacterized protein (TIGR02452 family)
MREKIRMLFSIAVKFGYTALVLSAWGCGAYHCPTEHVAELFFGIVWDFQYRLNTVAFCIRDHQQRKLFEKVFESYEGEPKK